MMAVHQLLENSAGAYPNKTALIYRDKTVVYRDLNEEVKQLARLLIQYGIKKGDRVGIYLEKSIEKVVSIFAVSKAGGIFVILNSSLKNEQVSYILADCDISKVLITSSAKANAIKNSLKKKALKALILTDRKNIDSLKSDFNLITFDTAATIPASDDDPEIVTSEDDLASIIYTSGSTGPPKGVMLTHRNIIYGALSVTEYLQNSHHDIILSLIPFSFDYGLNQLMTCIKVGGTLVLKKYLFPEEIVEIIAARQITGLAGIPAIWIQLLHARNLSSEKLRFLRYITNSGDKLPAPYVRQLRKLLPDTHIYLMYGFTEAFRSTYLDPSQVDRRRDSIGKAVPHASVFVINKEGRECGADEPGELIHGGPLVSKGYWNNPEETKKKIKPNPLSNDPTDLVCYSGDIVKKDKEGYLYFIARKNNIIKILGHRVNPQEIESHLYKHEQVKSAAVIGVPDDIFGQKIKAIVVPKNEHAITEKDILKHCRIDLPAHMMPESVLIEDRLPLTPNGKIDRQNLLERL